MPRPRDPDLALAAGFLVAHLVERAASPERAGSLAMNVVAAILMSVPMLWLRRHPIGAFTVVMTGAVVSQRWATGVDALFTAIVTLIVLGYSVARHHEGRRRAVALGVGLVGIGIAEALRDSESVIFVLGVYASGAVGGALLRRHADLTRELAERTHELDALRELRERDAVLDERRRIARELHDVVAHTVSVMVVQAAGARRQAPRDRDRALAALDQVETTGVETLAELQRLFGLLHPEDGARGMADLPGLVARVRAAGLEVRFDVDGAAGTLAPDADLAAYRLVQEALTNTLKHAGPATAAVAVRWAGDGVELVVTDTGAGPGGAPGEGARRGLAGMRERMELLGGAVWTGPRADGGFEVRARLPRAREEVQVA